MDCGSRVSVGIIGFGEMGKRHLLEYTTATRGRMEFPAVVEPEEARYEEGCEWSGRRPRRYASVDEMLGKEALDGLIIASPNATHLENLKSSVKSGLPIMLEKPLETSREKICDIARTAFAYEKPVMVDHVMRFSPIIRKAKKIIDSGAIGRVCSFNFTQYHPGGALFSTFRRTLAGGGGHLIEKATHDLDVAFYLCGARPLNVYGISRLQKYGGDRPDDLTCSDCDDLSCVDRLERHGPQGAGVIDVNMSHDLCMYASGVDAYDNEICLLECVDGVFGVYSHCYFVKNHISRRYEIIGTDGIIYMELSTRTRAPGVDGTLTVARSEKKPDEPAVEEHRFNYEGRIHYNGGPFAGRHFLDVITGKAEPLTTVQDAFVAEMAALAAMKSSDEGRRVDIEKDIIPRDLAPVAREAYPRRASG